MINHFKDFKNESFVRKSVEKNILVLLSLKKQEKFNHKNDARILEEEKEQKQRNAFLNFKTNKYDVILLLNFHV